MVMGIVRIVSNGLTKIFSNPITATNRITDQTSSAFTNQNKYVQPNTTETLNAIFKKV